MNNLPLENEPFVIALAADMRYSEQVITLIKSICYHHQHQKIKFYLLHKEFPPEWFDFMNHYLNQINCEIVSVRILNNDLHNFRTNKHISEVTYYRYFIAELPEDRMLYLDSDIVVNGNLSNFYYQDFQNSFVVAIPDMYLHYTDNPNKIKPYFNAGVLLINNQKWKEHNLSKQLLKLSELHSKYIIFGDQDILNMLLHQQCLLADKIYNYQTGARFCYYATKLYREVEEIEKLEQEPIIIHYTTSNKPWLLSQETNFREKYWFYYQLEWQEIIKIYLI